MSLIRQHHDISSLPFSFCSCSFDAALIFVIYMSFRICISIFYLSSLLYIRFDMFALLTNIPLYFWQILFYNTIPLFPAPVIKQMVLGIVCDRKPNYICMQCVRVFRLR